MRHDYQLLGGVNKIHALLMVILASLRYRFSEEQNLSPRFSGARPGQGIEKVIDVILRVVEMRRYAKTPQACRNDDISCFEAR
jgi:hypothetical protein